MLHHRTTDPHERARHCAERDAKEETWWLLWRGSSYVDLLALSMELQETYCREFAEVAEAAGGTDDRQT